MKLNNVEIKKQHQVEISNRFALLENLNVNANVYSAWESIREKMKISAKESLGYYRLKQHKLWFDKEYSKFGNQRKPAKLQWLQNLSRMNEDNLDNVSTEISTHFKSK